MNFGLAPSLNLYILQLFEIYLYGDCGMFIENHHSSEHLKQLIRKQTNAKMAMRLQVVLLAMEGKTSVEIPMLLPLSRRTVQKCVFRYNRYGLKGLQDNYIGGNSVKLNQQQKQKITNYIDAQANDISGGVRRASDLQDWIKENTGVMYSLSGVYYLLHSMGYSCLIPRPRHHKADPKAQQEFKKNFWTRCRKSQ